MSGRAMPAGWGQSLIDIEHAGEDAPTGKRDGEPGSIGLPGDHDGDDARRALIVFIILIAGGEALQRNQGRAQIIAETDQNLGRRRAELGLERELLRERDADDRSRQGALAYKDDDLITASIGIARSNIDRSKRDGGEHRNH